MFIREKRITREFTKTMRSGKIVRYNKSASVAYLKCDNCNTEFTRQIGKEIDRRRCNNNYSHYCSQCPSLSLAGKKGRETKRQISRERVGERMTTSHGYIRVWVGDTYTLSNHTYCGSIFEHTFVMEQHLGRALKRDEVVHHIDGNKQNNSIENLDVMTVDQHNKCHGQAANVLLFELLKENIIMYDRENKQYIRS